MFDLAKIEKRLTPDPQGWDFYDDCGAGTIKFDLREAVEEIKRLRSALSEISLKES